MPVKMQPADSNISNVRMFIFFLPGIRFRGSCSCFIDKKYISGNSPDGKAVCKCRGLPCRRAGRDFISVS